MDEEPDSDQATAQEEAPHPSAPSLAFLFAQSAGNAQSEMLLDLMPVGVVIYDASGEMIRCNPAAARLLETTQEELLRRRASGAAWTLFDEEGTPLSEADFPVNSVLAAHTAAQEQVIGIPRGASKNCVWLLVNAEPVFESRDRLAWVVATFTDITGRINADRDRFEAETRYRLLFDSSPLPTWVYDNETQRILAVNQAAIEKYGYTKEEFCALTAADLRAAPEVDAPEDGEETDTGAEVRKHRRKDGQVLDARITTQALRYCDRDARLAIAEDITARLQTERAAKRLAKRIENILASIRDGFITLDRQWQFTHLNPRAEQICGVRREDALKKNIWDVFPELRVAPIYHDLHRAMKKQNPVEIEHVSQQWNAALVLNVFPSQDGLSIYMADVSDRKRVERELQDVIGSLQRSVDGFVRAMSYAVELRDPYTAGHQKRVSLLVCAMARQMGFAAKDVKLMRVAALLHDIGKIAMPAEILSKPGNLSRAEMSIIQNHAQIGYDILKGIEFDPRVAIVALQHHERLDGSGYPNGLSSDEICSEAKMMAVADVVEAMGSHRPFRPSLGIEKALNEVMRNKGILYDPAAVEACLAVFAKHGFDFDILLRDEEDALSDEDE